MSVVMAPVVMESPSASQPPPDLGPVATLREKVGQTGTGIYLLTGYRERDNHRGQSYLQLVLEDATGRVLAFVWPEFLDAVLIPPIPSPVSILGTVRLFDARPQLKLQCLAGLDSAQLDCATALLPRHQCSPAVMPAFDRLAQLERELPAPLDGFLRGVLLDPELGYAFMRCRASVKHHHAFVGGLLVHSTQMLDMAAALARLVVPGDVWSPPMAQLGYLLHDLGKIRTVGEYRRPRYAMAVRHEAQTIELLAPHLRWLERRDETLAVGLRAVFDYLTVPFAARRIPEFVVAEIVVKLDQLSAAGFHGRGLLHLLGIEASSQEGPIEAPVAANDAEHEPEIRHAG